MPKIVKRFHKRTFTFTSFLQDIKMRKFFEYYKTNKNLLELQKVDVLLNKNTTFSS
jgi:hypothetical protein